MGEHFYGNGGGKGWSGLKVNRPSSVASQWPPLRTMGTDGSWRVRVGKLLLAYDFTFGGRWVFGDCNGDFFSFVWDTELYAEGVVD